MVSAASVCCCVLSVGAVLCHAAVSGAKALSYCLLPYGSQHQHGDKPVLMLFPDLLRHPAGTKCRNNYYPNYPGQLCLVFVRWGRRWGGWGVLWSAGGDTEGGGPTQKETTKRLVSCCLIRCILTYYYIQLLATWSINLADDSLLCCWQVGVVTSVEPNC